MVLNEVIMMEKQKSYENKVIFYTRFSIISTFFLAIGKLVLGIFNSQLLIVSAVFSFIVLAIRLYGFKHIFLNEKTTRKDSYIIGTLLIIASLIYGVYNIFLIGHKSTYDGYIAILIALVSFIEVGMSLAGVLRTSKSDHMFRNLKLISLSLALTSIVLTANALISFTNGNDNMTFFNDYLGIVVACIIFFIGIYILYSYRLGSDEAIIYAYFGQLDSQEEIALTKSYFYKEYYYEYKQENGVVAGKIKKKSSKLSKCPIYMKIIYGILSEILIFPYFIGLLVYTFKNMDLGKKLDLILINKGLRKCDFFNSDFEHVILLNKKNINNLDLHKIVDYLPLNIKTKYLSITNEEYFTSSILGYLILVMEIKKYYGFYYFPSFPEKGKPYDKELGLYFNISHSKDMISVIISKEDVGIDIEYYRHISDNIKKKYFKKKLSDKKATIEWTRLESALKLTGEGLSGINNLNMKKYKIKTIKFPEYALSIAKNKKIIDFKDIIFLKYNK